MTVVVSTEKGRVLRDLRKLLSRQRSLARRISRDEELADSIVQDLVELEGAIAGERFANAGDGAKEVRREARARAARTLRAAAGAGVTSLKVSKRADGSAGVRIDGGPEFELPKALADLLWVLAQDSGRSEDGLVGFKTLDEVGILLAKKQGRHSSRHAITQSIYRLRAFLGDRGGVNPFLVQTDRELGVRFALKRSG
jgi:hypothetical protein